MGGSEDTQWGKELRKELEPHPAQKERGKWAKWPAGRHGAARCVLRCVGAELGASTSCVRLGRAGRCGDGTGREPLCFVAEHGLSKLSFIAGRPFPVLCQLFLQEPCSASLPAFAMGHVPLPVTWGVKQSSCEKGREGRAGRESWERRQAAVPIPLLCFAALSLAGDVCKVEKLVV